MAQCTDTASSGLSLAKPRRDVVPSVNHRGGFNFIRLVNIAVATNEYKPSPHTTSLQTSSSRGGAAQLTAPPVMRGVRDHIIQCAPIHGNYSLARHSRLCSCNRNSLELGSVFRPNVSSMHLCVYAILIFVDDYGSTQYNGLTNYQF